MAQPRPAGRRRRTKRQRPDGRAGRGLLARAVRGTGRLLWWALRGLGAAGRALARSPSVHAALDLARRGLSAAGSHIREAAARFSAWLHRRFGRPITVGLAGFAFLGLALTPERVPLYQGADWAGDLECLAMNIYHEARNEPEAGKLAVGHVVMNRVADPRFPGTVCGVVMQGGQKPRNRCQFSWWCDAKDDRPLNKRAWAESQFFASHIFAGNSKDPTGGALWYHADYVEPAWRKTFVEGPQIGRHKFYLRN
ncbi:MAG: cell wall hydrolase [Rhodospirillales bacterium]|nr:cell wall hydrolase [Rhodospirillales bacterium]MDH3792906.1 cell wall hydrolase [Rhodospirillales bacterium]MDH3909833.1 cell wall hydrolase [Rhodospirillales bacterium]MDH3917760.1 cell wall hydrolase [Rhodospirillales bacterium]MDH3966698.1 cell wall hydrolase [Rhodospirillales bacterium]